MPTLMGTPTQITLTGLTANAWNTNISSGAPSGSTGAILLFTISSNTGSDVTVRMSGSTDVQHSTTANTLTTGMQKCLYTGINSSGQFDLYPFNSTINLKAYLLGYFGSEATFFTNAVQLAALGTSFSQYNVQSSCPVGIAAFVDVFNVRVLTLRQNSSTDTWSPSLGSFSQIVGLNSNQIFQGSAGTAGPTPYLRGYMTTGVTWHLNGINLSGTGFPTGQFNNLPTSGVGGIYQLSGSAAFTLCGQACNTGTFNPQLSLGGPNSGQIASAAPAMFDPASGTPALYELGSFTVSQSTGAAQYASPGISGPF